MNLVARRQGAPSSAARARASATASPACWRAKARRSRSPRAARADLRPPRAAAHRDRRHGAADRGRRPPGRRLRARRAAVRANASAGIDILVNNDGAPPLGEIESFDDAPGQGRRAEPDVRRAPGARRVAVDARERLGAHRQHHGVVGDAAAAALRPVGRHVGRRDRLREDAVARDRRGRHHRQHDLPGLHRHGAARHGLRRRRARRDRRRPEGAARAADPDGPRRAARRDRRHWWRSSCSPWAAYITGAVHHVDGGRRASLL